MAQKRENFSQEELSRLLRQPQALELMNRLRQLDRAALEEAVRLAMAGDQAGAVEALEPVMNDGQVQSLTRQMRDGYGGI